MLDANLDETTRNYSGRTKGMKARRKGAWLWVGGVSNGRAKHSLLGTSYKNRTPSFLLRKPRTIDSVLSEK